MAAIFCEISEFDGSLGLANTFATVKLYERETCRSDESG
jgi:hypothetical protein